MSKPCTTCKHKVASLWNVISPNTTLCKHPSIPANPITGKPGTSLCKIMRNPLRSCGQKGNYHEQI